SVFVIRRVTGALAYAVGTADRIASGDWDSAIEVSASDETGKLLGAMREMRDTLKRKRDEDKRIERRKAQLAEINDRMRGDQNSELLANNVLTFLVQALDAQVGAFYVYEDDVSRLKL